MLSKELFFNKECEGRGVTGSKWATHSKQRLCLPFGGSRKKPFRDTYQNKKYEEEMPQSAYPMTRLSYSGAYSA